MKKLLIFLLMVCTASAAYLPQQARSITLLIPTAPIATSGSPVDAASVTVPVNITNYIIKAVYVRAITASGTLAAGTVDLRTATAGGGSSVLTAATALTGLTAASLVQSVAPAALGTNLTATTLTLRQTVNSLNAGTVMVVIEILDMSPQT